MIQEPTRLVPLSDKHLQLISLLTDETLRATGSKYAALCVDLFRHIDESLQAMQEDRKMDTSEPHVS